MFSTSSTTSSLYPTHQNSPSFPSNEIPKETGYWSMPPPQTSQIEDTYKFTDPWEDIYNKTDENYHIINETNRYNNYSDIGAHIPNYHTTQNYLEEQNSHQTEEYNYNCNNNYLSSQQMCNKLDEFKYSESEGNLQNENNFYDPGSHEKSNEGSYNNGNHFDNYNLNENRVERTENCDYHLQNKEEFQHIGSDSSKYQYHQEEPQKHSQHTDHIPTHHQNSISTTHPLPHQKHFPPDNAHEEGYNVSTSNEEEVRVNLILVLFLIIYLNFLNY